LHLVGVTHRIQELKFADFSEVSIGKLLIWDPYVRLVPAWQIDSNFQYDTELITEVEVQFIVGGALSTNVLFAHKELKELDGGVKVIEGIDEG